MHKYIIISGENDYGAKAIEATYQKLNNVVINKTPENSLHGLLWLLYKCHNTPRINRIINLPFRSIWAKAFLDKYVREFINGEDKLCFIFSGADYNYEQIGVFAYLRKKYKGCKMAYFFGDKMGLYENRLCFSLQKIKDIFDLVCTYNKIDAEKYGLLLTPPRVLDYEHVVLDESIPESDVIFVGREKGRLDDILHVYEVCKENSLRCDFHIVGVPEERQRYSDDIVYNKFMTYDEVMRRTKRSRCILNLMQADTEGISLRDYEAIGMNKMLITNNNMVFSSEFYTPDKLIRYENISTEISKIRKYNPESGWNGIECYSAEKYFEWLGASLEG